jgi:hypothetical protein
MCAYVRPYGRREAAPIIRRRTRSVDDLTAVSAAIPGAQGRRQTWADVDAVIAATSSLDQIRVIGDDSGRPTLRWILAHLLEETARHAGHADILRELIDGATGR